MNDGYSNNQSTELDYGCGCKDINQGSETEKSIKNERNKLCVDLYAAAGEVFQYELKYDSIDILESYKNCSFVWSEEYYHYYRDLNLDYGSKILQSTESIKEAVKANIASGKELAEVLKAIAKSVKDVNIKMKELSTAAFDITTALKDPCNCAAVALITGKTEHGCKDTGKPTPKPPSPECDYASKNLKDLTDNPQQLSADLNKLITAAFDVVGIQVFSSVSSLDEPQKELNEQAKKFDTHIQESVKKGEGAVKKSYDDLSKIAQELAKAGVDRTNKRSVFEGLLSTAKDLCCEHCGCIKDNNCADKICAICARKIETPLPCPDLKKQ